MKFLRIPAVILALLTGGCAGTNSMDLANHPSGASLHSSSFLDNNLLMALKAEPSNASLHYQVGLKYFTSAKHQNYELANAAFSQAYRNEPNDPKNMLALASTQYALGNYTSAMLLLLERSKYLNLKANDLIKLSAVAYRAGYFDIANSCFQKADSILDGSSSEYDKNLYQYLKLAFGQTRQLDAKLFRNSKIPANVNNVSDEESPSWSRPTSEEEVFIDAVIIENTITSSASSGRNLLQNLSLSVSGSEETSSTLQKNETSSFLLETIESNMALNLVQSVQYSLNIFNDSGYRTKVQSSPNVLARLNNTSTLEKTSNIRNLTLYNSSYQTAEKPISVGIKLAVTPLLITKDFVDLEVNVENSSFTLAPVDVSITNRGNPIIHTDKVSTKLKAMVPYGKAVSVGGITHSFIDEGNSGVTGVKKVPVIGKLFGNRESESKRTDTLVLISARKKKSEIETIDQEKILKEIGLTHSIVNMVGKNPVNIPQFSLLLTDIQNTE